MQTFGVCHGVPAGLHTLDSTHRLLSSSFLGLPYRILNVNHEKELLRSLWVSIPKFLNPEPKPKILSLLGTLKWTLNPLKEPT